MSDPRPNPAFTTWPSFPFVGDLQLKSLDEPVPVEPAREGEDPAECRACNTPDDAYVWVSERWRVRSTDQPTGLPAVLFLEPRSHLDLGDLPNLLSAELGVMTVRLERAVRSLDGVGRVYVNRWGDGAAHLHVWFMARPYGQLQLRGSFLPMWNDILPPITEAKWRENLALVAAWLAEFGGRAIAEPPHIQWQAPARLDAVGPTVVEAAVVEAAVVEAAVVEFADSGATDTGADDLGLTEDSGNFDRTASWAVDTEDVAGPGIPRNGGMGDRGTSRDGGTGSGGGTDSDARARQYGLGPDASELDGSHTRTADLRTADAVTTVVDPGTSGRSAAHFGDFNPSAVDPSAADPSAADPSAAEANDDAPRAADPHTPAPHTPAPSTPDQHHATADAQTSSDSALSGLSRRFTWNTVASDGSTANGSTIMEATSDDGAAGSPDDISPDDHDTPRVPAQYPSSPDQTVDPSATEGRTTPERSTETAGKLVAQEPSPETDDSAAATTGARPSTDVPREPARG